MWNQEDFSEGEAMSQSQSGAPFHNGGVPMQRRQHHGQLLGGGLTRADPCTAYWLWTYLNKEQDTANLSQRKTESFPLVLVGSYMIIPPLLIIGHDEHNDQVRFLCSLTSSPSCYPHSSKTRNLIFFKTTKNPEQENSHLQCTVAKMPNSSSPSFPFCIRSRVNL